MPRQIIGTRFELAETEFYKAEIRLYHSPKYQLNYIF